MQLNTEHQQHHARPGQPVPAPVADLTARRQARDGRAHWETSVTAAAEALFEAERRPAPPEAAADQTAAFTAVMWEAAIAEGQRRAYTELGIPCPSQPSPAQRHLSAAPDPAPELPELEAEP